jgi:undecaprenyl-diphosphatase
MFTYPQAIIIGLLQGISELFPISSLGHSVILPKLLGWNINQNDPFFITFLVATHTATAIVLLGFFWKDWVRIVKGMWQSLVDRQISQSNIPGRLGWLLVVGSIPAGILGLLLEEPLRALFASAKSAAFFLILNGLLLYGAELLRRKAPKIENEDHSDTRVVTQLSWNKALMTGAAQALALIPGLSRSGSSMAGGLLAGLSNEDAARYSFLLATPIIAAASLLKLPEFSKPENHALIGQALVGALCAGVSAFFAVRFLTRFFETNRLTPFAIYCVVTGALSLLFLQLR